MVRQASQGDSPAGRPRPKWLLALRLLPAAALVAVIFYMSNCTRPPGRWLGEALLGRYLSRDKPLHFIAYAALAAAIVWPLWSGFRLRGWSVALGWLLASACAALDEVHQVLVPGRSGSFRDFLLDSSGALAGCVVVGAVYALFKWRRIVALVRSRGSDNLGGSPVSSEEGDPEPQMDAEPQDRAL